MELFRARAIGLQDLESWKHNKNKIFNIGIPAYAFLECFLRSIKNSSPGFIIRKGQLLTFCCFHMPDFVFFFLCYLVTDSELLRKVNELTMFNSFLLCFFSSLTGDNVEITGVNRPEGRLFDWLYEPMCIMKEQVRHMNLTETEELYFYKHCLYSGDVEKVETWQNGGIPPSDEIRRGQMEGISRR